MQLSNTQISNTLHSVSIDHSKQRKESREINVCRKIVTEILDGSYDPMRNWKFDPDSYEFDAYDPNDRSLYNCKQCCKIDRVRHKYRTVFEGMKLLKGTKSESNNGELASIIKILNRHEML